MTLSRNFAVGGQWGKKFSFHLSCYPTTPGGIRTIDGAFFAIGARVGFLTGERWATWSKLGCWDYTATRAVVACEPYTHHRLLCSLSGAMTFPQSYYFFSLRSRQLFRCLPLRTTSSAISSKASLSPPQPPSRPSFTLRKERDIS